MSENTASIESLKELTPKERWTDEIRMAELELKKFHERGRRAVKRFLDERDVIEAENKWFNLYYTNTGIMESALYAQPPKPIVARRFKDYDDDVARVAALILERCITPDPDDPRDTFDSTMRACVQDRLIPGLAAAWLRLETETAAIPYEEALGADADPNGPPKDYQPYQRITDQKVCVDYVYWNDFLFSPCRIWAERRWVGRRVYMDRDALVRRFGEKIGKQVPLDHSPTRMDQNVTGDTPKYEVLKKACIYEIWDRGSKKVFWLSKSYPEILDTKDDPLQLVGFEPCPMPLLANVTTSNCTPRPDLYMIQDQYTELDTLNNRISMLLQACKVVGVHDKGQPAIARMLTEGFDNQLIPVDSWAAFAEKGGVKGAIDWLPLDAVVAALTQLVQNREIVKQQIYELTGISDIVRGATKASETLGAQELKSKFASMSIKKRQDEVTRFAADILRIKAEIQVKHFQPEFLLAKSNIMATGEANAALVEPALALLMSDEGFEWRIQVTPDSMAQADYALEKTDRLEFLNTAGTYIEKTTTMLKDNPKSAPLFVALLKWGVAGFRNAAEIEGMLDQELDKLSKEPEQPKQPTPEEQRAQAEQAKLQAQMQMEQQRAQIKMQADQQAAALKAQSQQQEMAFKAQMQQMELRFKEMEFQFKVRELELKERELTMEMKFEEAEAARQERVALMESQLNLRASAAQQRQSIQFNAEAHRQRLAQQKANGNATH